MKLPALKDLASAIRQTFVRFPFAILCALVATAMGFILAGLTYEDQELKSQLMRGVMTMYLGMLAGITCSVFCERYFFRTKTQYVFNIVILLLMHYYYYTLPETLGEKEATRFVVLALSAHLSLSFAPFLVDNEPNGFWQFNRQLFLRILTSFFYSQVLFLGLMLALFAIDNLFGAHVEPQSYLRLYIVITGLFNTLFFLSGVPEEVSNLDSVKVYPKGLRIFTQFVLLPLIGLYLLILYIYGFKIIATQVWPEGWVAWLVVGFSTAGILAFLLVWPLRLNAEYQWIKTYSRFFYIALFPLIVLLFAALWKRVNQYGLTEHRYFIFILACWLAAMAIYFLFSPVKNIKIIPLTLFILSILSAYGPWSAFEMSEHSQHKRLKSLLEENGMLQNGKAVKAKNELTFLSKREISATTDYLINMHGLYSIQNLFTINLDSACKAGVKKDEYIFRTGKVLALLGVDYTYGDEDYSAEKQFVYSVKEDGVIKTQGFTYAVSFSIANDNEGRFVSPVFTIDSLDLQMICSSNRFTVTCGGANDAVIDLAPVLSRLKKDYGNRAYEIPPDRISFDLQGTANSYRLLIRSINANVQEGNEDPDLSYLGGYLLLNRK